VRDPVFGIEDPDAGAWFRKVALHMANNAIPAFP
jgi:hypothetical protein